MLNNEDLNLLTLKEYTTIMSEITKAPFVDKSGACYMFELSHEADLFCENNPHTYKGESRHMNGIKYWISNLYLNGVKAANLKTRESDEFHKVEFSPEDVKQNLYINHETNFHLLQLRQYNLAKDLRALSNGTFIVPVLLPERSEGDYPTINYCYVQRENERLYVLFSNLSEFKTWNASQGNKFLPLATDFIKAKRIRTTKYLQKTKGIYAQKELKEEKKKHSILINPLSDKIILTNDLLARAMEKKQ